MDVVDLGPEIFASADLTVINYKGENYYKACGEFVRDLPGGQGQSTCVKRVGHPHNLHEDFDGNFKYGRA